MKSCKLLLSFTSYFNSTLNERIEQFLKNMFDRLTLVVKATTNITFKHYLITKVTCTVTENQTLKKTDKCYEKKVFTIKPNSSILLGFAPLKCVSEQIYSQMKIIFGKSVQSILP